MPEQKIELTVQINSKTGELEVVGKGLKEAGKAAEDAEKGFLGLGAAGDRLATALAGVVSARALFNFFRDSVRQAEDYAQQMARVKFAVEAAGGSFKTAGSSVKTWADQIQKSTRFNDSEALEALNRMLRATNSLTQAQNAAQLAMGISAATGKPLAEVQEQIAEAVSGNQRATMLLRKEFGAYLGDATNGQAVMNALVKHFGDAALNEESMTAKSAQLGAAIDDLKKKIGEGINPALTEMITLLTRSITQFEAFSKKSAPAIAQITQGMERATKAMLTLGTSEIFGKVATAAEKASEKIGILETKSAAAAKNMDAAAKKAADSIKKTGDITVKQISIMTQVTEGASRHAADVMSGTFAKSFIDTAVRGKAFQLDMVEIFAQIAEEIVRLTIQLLALKALKVGFGGPAGLLAPGGLGNPDGNGDDLLRVLNNALARGGSESVRFARRVSIVSARRSTLASGG